MRRSVALASGANKFVETRRFWYFLRLQKVRIKKFFRRKPLEKISKHKFLLKRKNYFHFVQLLKTLLNTFNIKINLAINNFTEILVELRDNYAHYLINDFDEFDILFFTLSMFIQEYKIIDETYFDIDLKFAAYVQKLLPMYSKSNQRNYDAILNYLYYSNAGKPAGFKHMFHLLFSFQQQNLKKTL